MAAFSVIESARISAVVEEALEKLSFLASITPDVMAHRDELSQIVGDEITRIIQEQRGLETRYEHLISQRTQLKALSNKNKFNENQEQVKEVARALRESTKELCRNLKVCARAGAAAWRCGDGALRGRRPHTPLFSPSLPRLLSRSRSPSLSLRATLT